MAPGRLQPDRGVRHHVIAAAAVEDDGKTPVLVRLGVARRLIDERSGGDGDVLERLFIGADDAAPDDIGVLRAGDLGDVYSQKREQAGK